MDAATREGASAVERLEAYLLAEEAPPEETPEPVEEAPEEAEATEEEVEEGEEFEASEEDDADAEESEADAEEGQEEQLGLEDLAQYLKLDADQLDVDEDGQVYVKTKVDGEEGRATLKDLIKSYQLEGHLNRQNMEVAEQRKQLQAKMQEIEQQSQGRLQQLDDALNIAYQELQADYQAINWQQLKDEDPTEYAVKRQDFADRQARLQQAAQRLQGERERLTQEQSARFQEVLQREQQALLQAVPEWSDSAVAAKERAELKSWAQQAGFTPEELGQVADHRVVVALRKAMLYDKLQSAKPAIEKKVKAAPKRVAKPGQPKSQQERKQDSLKAVRSVIKQSGGKKGIAEYLLKAGKV